MSACKRERWACHYNRFVPGQWQRSAVVVLLSAADCCSLSRSTAWVQTLWPLGRGRVSFSGDESDGLARTVHHGSVKRNGALLLSEMGEGNLHWSLRQQLMDKKKISKAEKMGNLKTHLECECIPSKLSYATINGFGKFLSSMNWFILTQTKSLVLRPFYLYLIRQISKKWG